MLKTITIQDIRALEPCYDPAKYLPEGWQGTVWDILDNEEIPAADRIWVVLHNNYIDTQILRLFAIQCTKAVLAKLNQEPYSECVAAIETAEKYLQGLITYEGVKVFRQALLTTLDHSKRKTGKITPVDAVSCAAVGCLNVSAEDAAYQASWDAAFATGIINNYTLSDKKLCDFEESRRIAREEQVIILKGLLTGGNTHEDSQQSDSQKIAVAAREERSR